MSEDKRKHVSAVDYDSAMRLITWNCKGAFARKHAVSLDWLIDGDLKGLLRTVRWRNQLGSASG